MNTTSVTYGSHSSKIASFGRYGLHLIYSPNGKIIPVGTVPSYLLPFPKFDSMGEAVTYCVKEIEKNGDGSHLG